MGGDRVGPFAASRSGGGTCSRQVSFERMDTPTLKHLTSPPIVGRVKNPSYRVGPAASRLLLASGLFDHGRGWFGNGVHRFRLFLRVEHQARAQAGEHDAHKESPMRKVFG